MAKKIQIDIEVNGKMQKATVSAKKLRDALGGVEDASDRVGKSARETDRNIKGTAQASSNATKNFSKMSQGMGGLVGAYASLAASLFAVSAAFNFLKSAGELKSLRAGQIAYASSTGVAINTLTEDIIRATDSQIAFRDAAQAAAIGSAAGLNADQLTRLGKAAADASQILGRDVTDSFNRLVRGATKAEPELLDELGIILRLDDASQKYATSLGINATELTTFQKQQAVTNDILTQAEEKYGRILDIVGRSPNQYAQLQKAFDDIIMSVKEVVDMVAGPLAKVLQETPALAVASLGVLLSGPLKALGLSFTGIAESAKESAAAQKIFYRSVRDEVKLASKSAQDYRKDLRALANVGIADGAKAGFLTTLSRGKDLGGAELARFKSAVKAAENNVNSSGVIIKGAFTGMKIHMVREMSEAYAAMNAAQDSTLRKTELFAMRSKAAIAGISATVKGLAAGIAGIFSRILSIASYGALAFTGYSMYKEFTAGPLTDQEKELQANAEATEAFRERLVDLNKEFEKFAEIQMELGKTQGVSAYGNLSGLFGGQNPAQTKRMLTDLKELGKVQESMVQNAKEAEFIDTAARVAGGVGFLATASAGVGLGAAVGSIVPGIGTAIGAALGAGVAAVGSLVASDVFVQPLLDEVRQAGKLPDDLTGGDSQARAARNQQRDETEKRLLQLRDGILAVQESSGAAYAPVTEFLEAIDQILTSDVITTEMIEQFEKAKEGALNFSDSMTGADLAIKTANDSLAQFLANTAKLTPAQQLVEQLAEADKELTFKLGGTFTDPEEKDKLQAQQALIRAQLESAKVIATFEERKKDIQLEINSRRMRLLGDESDADKARLNFHNKMLDLTLRRRLIELDILRLEEARNLLLRKNPDKKGGTADLNMKRELDRLRTSVELITAEMEDTSRSLQINLSKIGPDSLRIENDRLKSQQKILALQKQGVDAERQLLNLRKQADDREINAALREERLRNPFYYLTEDNRRAQMELDAARRQHRGEIQQIEKERDQKIAAIQGAQLAAGRAIQDQRRSDMGPGSDYDTDSKREARNAQLNAEIAAGAVASKEQQEAALAYADEAKAAADERLKQLEAEVIFTNELFIQYENLARSFEEGMVDAFAGIIDGSKSAKEAFQDFFKMMMQEAARAIAKLLVMEALTQSMSFFGLGSGGGAIGKLFGFGRYGGIMEPPKARYGGILEGYSAGGIARGSDAGHLAMLHGTEAVVPLPNGRSIPVELQGGGSQTNNVSVNVNIENSGRSSVDMEGQDPSAFAKSITNAVQREIQNQKRPGGLLSPYGGR